MSLLKYKKQIFVSGIVIGLLTLTLTLPMANQGSGISPVVPFESGGFEFAFLFTLMWISSIIGSYFFGYLLTPLYLLIHKKIIGPKMTYGLVEVKDPNPDKFKGIFKAFFPALLALNLAIIFSQSKDIQVFILNPKNVLEGASLTNMLMSIIILLPLMSGIGIAIFSPVWFLLDSGIIYSNEKRILVKKRPLEVKSVGGWYM